MSTIAGPRHWTRDRLPERFETYCAHADCAEGTNNEGDFAKCEGCLKRYCADHLLRIGDLYFCEACATCSVCKQSAGLICQECGDLICGTHAKAVDTQESETGYRTSGVVCRNGCGQAHEQAPEVFIDETYADCPY